MKKLSFILVLAILLAGGAVAAMSAPSYAQVYDYPGPPPDHYAHPWVGPNTPWVYYNGDWFLNGILYYFFGSRYGWAPYYAYPPVYIVRPQVWYAPKWLSWYQGHPHYWEGFRRSYPYWGGHRSGQRYDMKFYERHHHRQGEGWHKGFKGRTIEGPPPKGQRPPPARVAPPPRERERPAPAPRVAPPERERPAPAPRVAPPEGQKPPPGRVAPPEGQKPPPARVAPPPREGKGPAPAPRVAPPEGRKPAPAPAPPAEGGKGGAPDKAPKPEKGGPGEDKR